ncbi:MAG: nucleotidyltransferase family protein [Casimicrobiaceae bacterium]
MTRDREDVLGDALRDIDCVFADAGRWEPLIRRAREGDLLGTLAHRLAERGLLQRVPDAPRAHLVAAQITFKAQETAVRREVAEIAQALRQVGTPVILLKGAAYLLARLPPSRGRFFSDIDILVPKVVLPAVESALMLAGFATTHHHPYDQRYYRRWMHELPPMQHVKRMTVLDVHHTIVPETAPVRLDADKLFRSAIPLTGRDDFSVLAPADMVLHSATHLFHNEELTHGLRDLVDIDALLRHFGSDAHFWDDLVARAAELDLGRPLYYALRWTSRLLRTPVPAFATRAAERHAPSAPVNWLMDVLLAPALYPTADRRSTRWARRGLYVRGHWLRMPMPLLAWHLTVKTFRREEQPA